MRLIPRPSLPAVIIAFAILSGFPRAQSQVPSMEGYPAVGSPSVVTLLAAGAAPRMPLRYKLAAGQKGTMEMTTAMGVTMSMAGMSMPPTELPLMKMTADIGVTGVAPNGDITYDLAFTGMTAEGTPGMDSSLVAMVQAAASNITSLKGTATVSNRGVTRGAKFDLTQIADPNLRQTLTSISGSIENLSMAFPEEAVGVGGKWEVRQAMSTGGAHTFQKSTYEVVSMTGNEVKLNVAIDQQTPRQPIENPALPAGASMEIEKISSTGSGALTVRLDSLIPTSEVNSTSNATMLATMSGQTQQMSMETRIKITIKPAGR